MHILSVEYASLKVYLKKKQNKTKSISGQRKKADAEVGVLIYGVLGELKVVMGQIATLTPSSASRTTEVCFHWAAGIPTAEKDERTGNRYKRR